MSVDNYVITKSGIKVYRDYKDNLCCDDRDNKTLTEKAKNPREKYNKGEAIGLSRLGSESSEDALTWSVFRTLELENKMGIFYNLIDLKDNLKKTIFWTRDISSGEVDRTLQETLNEIEPKNLWKIQQTEPDVVLVGTKTIVFNESKLGHSEEKVLGWARGKPFEKRHNNYKRYLDGIFSDDFKNNFDNLGVRFYQLMRNMIIRYHYAKKLRLNLHLAVVVNELNTTDDYKSHKDKFVDFSKYVIDKERIHFTTWQEIKEATSRDKALKKLHECLENHSCFK